MIKYKQDEIHSNCIESIHSCYDIVFMFKVVTKKQGGKYEKDYKPIFSTVFGCHCCRM